MKRKDLGYLRIFIPVLMEILIFVCFYTIIQEEGSVLFSYVYLVYFFLKVVSASSFFASYKTTKDYPELAQEKDKRIFDLEKCFFGFLGIILFVLIMFFAPNIAFLSVKDNTNISEIAFVIRMMAISFLSVPVLNVVRGYLLSRDYKKEVFCSVIIEKILSLFGFMITGILCQKVFHLALFKTIGVSSLAMIIGSIFSFLYFFLLFRKNSKFKKSASASLRNPVPKKEVLKKIFSHFKPIIIIGLFFFVYQFIDLFTLTHLYVSKFDYTLELSQKIMSVISTFGFLLNVLLVVIIGIVFLMIYRFNLNESFDVVEIIQKEFPKLVYVGLPITILFAILSRPVWILFYGKSVVMESVYGIYAFSGFAFLLFLFVFALLFIAKEYRVLFSFLGISLLLKISLDVAFSSAFVTMSLKAYYGPIFSSILGNLCFVFLGFVFYYFKYKIDYENLLHRVFDIIISSLIMAILLLVFQVLFQRFASNRIISFLIIVVSSIIGTSIYLWITKKNGLTKLLFLEAKNKKSESV